MVKFAGAGGTVNKGDIGSVAGPCKGYTGRGAEARLNCRFPGHPNINLKTTQIRKLEPGEGDS